MKNSGRQKQLRNRLIAIAAAIVVIIVALVVFINVNSARIVAQNSEYLETSTSQTARRVSDLFESSLESVQMITDLYEKTLDSSDVDPKDAIDAFDLSKFDHCFFITPDGVAKSHDGRTALALDREYYNKGIQGESGMCFIEDALFDGEKIVAFYSPIRYQGEIAGVLVCVYNEETLTEIMTTMFYGQQTPTYLLTPDGSIVAKAVPYDSNVGTIDEVLSADHLEDATLDQISKDIAEGRSSNFKFKTENGVGNSYLTQLASFDWMIMRSFPASITNEMLLNANLSGLILVGGVFIAAILVSIVLLIQSRNQNKKLLLERQEADRIIDVSTNLFVSLLSIDLADGTYEYLKNSELESEMPSEGSYENFCEVLGKTLKPLNDEGKLALFDPSEIKESLSKNVPFFQQECHMQGSPERWLRISILCLTRDSKGVPTQVLVAVQDITDTKLAEIESHNALKDAFQAAEHASQAKSDFLNSMSHDIRTPMNSIMGLTAIAGMHVDDPERVRECLANITSASRHLLGLINEVLDMAKIESGKISLAEEEFELSEIIDSLITIINPQVAAKHQELKVELVNIKHEHVIGDSTRLEQVFVNIVINSVKFTPDGGKISMRITELPSHIPENACFEFVFSDTGCGMSPEFVKTVFEPFTRANDSRTTKIEGTGLGMAIVNSVVSMMNGTIEVDSTEGVGTTFTVTLHLKLRDGKQEDLSILQDVRVLVVDDDEIASEGACLLLDDIGMRSEYVTSGQEGIDAVVKAEKDGDPFSAVILDWRMPGMSGIDAARKIREVTVEHVPIIILSAYDWSIIEQEAREVGVDAFISKPLLRSRLVQVMKELMGGEVASINEEQALLESLQFEGKRILLTEDNAMAAIIAQELLGLTGADTDHAENGKLAVDALLNHEPGYYDVVLMDIQMPVMNGYEAASAIRAAAKDRPDLTTIPIIALSADAFAEDVKHSRASGMNDHMAKPLEIETLVRMLRKWIG